MTWLAPTWLFVALALLLLALWPRLSPSSDGWRRVMSPAVHALLMAGGARRRPAPLMLAAALASVALARPAVPAPDSAALIQSQGWVLAIDVSRSMSLADVAPDRLAAARETALALLAAADSRPVAIVLFAGDAYLAGPFTFDKRHEADFLLALKPEIVPLPGSDVRRALALAARAIADSGLVESRVFLLTDAAGPLAPAEPVAAQLATQGHRLDVLVMARDAAVSGQAPDLDAATHLAKLGGGQALQADVLGRVSLASILVESRWLTGHDGFVRSPLSTLAWESLSAWVLLGVVPLLLISFSGLRP